MPYQAQRSNQIYESSLASVNHIANIANGTITKALGLTVPLHIADTVSFIGENEGEKKSKTVA